MCTLLRGSSGLYEPVRLRQQLFLQHKSLGPMSWRESMVLIDFVVLAMLWITREPKVVPGWGSMFTGTVTLEQQ